MEPVTESLPRKLYSRKEMMRRVARFDQLKGFDGGLADSYHPTAFRTLYNVIGFQPPKSEDGVIGSPVGRDAARNAAIKVSEGFNLGYCRAKPGCGPMMHNHDTNETFICMTGVWRASWLNPKGKEESVDLNPLDTISFPPGAIRRFMNLKKGPRGAEGVLMFVIGGDAPNAEFSKESVEELQEIGLWSPDGKPPKGAKLKAQPKPASKAKSVTKANSKPKSKAKRLSV
jgi:quercetin dioxygenase-like cupin family protein